MSPLTLIREHAAMLLVVQAHAQGAWLADDWHSKLLPSCPAREGSCLPLKQLAVPVLAWLFIVGACSRQQVVAAACLIARRMPP